MARNRQKYAKNTWTETVGPWGIFTRARAICPDGKPRVVTLSFCADSFWTVPAKLSYQDKTVCGFVTFESEDGLTTNPEQWVAFVPMGKHKSIFQDTAASAC